MVDKWFSLQAVAMHTDVTAVRKLMTHPAFTLKNPNRARSLIFSFCNGNPSQFHAADGSGYAFWAEQVIALNKLNASGTRAGSLEIIPVCAEKIDVGRVAESSSGQGIVEGCAGGSGSGFRLEK